MTVRFLRSWRRVDPLYVFFVGNARAFVRTTLRPARGRDSSAPIHDRASRFRLSITMLSCRVLPLSSAYLFAYAGDECQLGFEILNGMRLGLCEHSWQPASGLYRFNLKNFDVHALLPSLDGSISV